MAEKNTIDVHKLAKYKGDDDSITYAALMTELNQNPGRVNERDGVCSLDRL